MRALLCSLGISLTVGLSLVSMKGSDAAPTLISQSHPALEYVTAGGDSYAPIMSPDGRYVLFTSTAPDLVPWSNNVAQFVPSASRLNVFLTDRVEGTSRLASGGVGGLQDGNGESVAISVSTNGQFVLFESTSSNLVPNDNNNASDIFLRDISTGTTMLVSAGASGASANGSSRDASMSPDGRYVAFVTDATDLGPLDTNNIADVYVRDTVAQTTVPGSVGAVSASGGLTESSEPSLSSNGRYVVFLSNATNLVPGIRTVGEIYVRDLVLSSNFCASIEARQILLTAHGTTNGFNLTPAISQDGRYVLFQIGNQAGILLRYDCQTASTQVISTNTCIPRMIKTHLNNMSMSSDGQKVAVIEKVTGSSTCIRFWDADLGSSVFSSDGTATTQPVSTCHWPLVAPGGSWFAYVGRPTDGNQPNPGYNIVFRDLPNSTTHFLNQRTNNTRFPFNSLHPPSLSADGMLVAFDSSVSDLAPGDRNNANDIFVRNRTNNIIEVVSRRNEQLDGGSPNGASGLSANSFSSSAFAVAFASDAENLLPGDTNGFRDIFVRDIEQGTNLLVSIATNGTWANGASWDPSISSNGQFVAFTSRASNLIAGDANNAPDVFLRDLNSGQTRIVSLKSSGSGAGNGSSGSPQLSHDGRFVLFRSFAGDLASGSSSGTENVYLRDMVSGVTRALTTGGSVAGAVMTSDASYVVCGITGANPHWKVWDTAAQQYAISNNVSGLSRVLAISPNLKVVYSTSSGMFINNLQTGTNQVLCSTPATLHAGAAFSHDSRFLAYSTTITNGQVFLYDFSNGSNLLVSRRYTDAGYASHHSDSPSISADGRFVVYRSDATNLVSEDLNKFADIFVFDRVSNTTTLLSASRNGLGGNGWSHSPRFAPDGKTLVFASRASDLHENDLNDQSDLFIYRFEGSGAFPVYIAIVDGLNRPRLIWPAQAGTQYRVEFKNSVDEPIWQQLDAPIAISLTGSHASVIDPQLATAHRIYRVVAD